MRAARLDPGLPEEQAYLCSLATVLPLIGDSSVPCDRADGKQYLAIPSGQMPSAGSDSQSGTHESTPSCAPAAGSVIKRSPSSGSIIVSWKRTHYTVLCAHVNPRYYGDYPQVHSDYASAVESAHWLLISCSYSHQITSKIARAGQRKDVGNHQRLTGSLSRSSFVGIMHLRT
jgi:hypothetical protein